MRRLLIAALLGVAGVSTVGFHYWRQATQLPEWYTQPVADTNRVQPKESIAPAQVQPLPSPTQVEIPRPVRPQPVAPQPLSSPLEQTAPKVTAAPVQKPPEQKTARVPIKEPQLKQLFNAEVARKAEASGLSKAVKGVNTTVQNGTVESGAVVNLGEISIDQLPNPEREAIANLISRFPQLGDRTVYIGVEGQPIVQNGQIQLGDTVRIRLGELRFTPAELAERLGVSEDQIRQQIELQLQLGNLKVDGMDLQSEQIAVPE